MKDSPITDILPSGSWKGKRCFILGGGPSLEHFNFGVLKDELVIGINKAFLKFPGTLNYSMDRKFYGYVTGEYKHPDLVGLPQLWDKYGGIKVFLKSSNNKSTYRNVYTVKKHQIREVSFDLAAGIYSGSNSGIGAVMLAIALGANPIYLLGYDMKISAGNTHWHEGYPNQQPNPLYEKKLKRYMRRFEDLAPLIAEANISAVNLNPMSDLRCFPIDTIDKVLAQ